MLSLFKLAALGVHTMLVAPAIVVTAAFDDRLAYRLCELWSRANLLVFGIDVRSRRLAPLDPTRPYVFMANHTSHLDVLAVVAALPEMQLRWVAKKELLDVPVFGWALKHAGHIIIDRQNNAQAVASLRAAREKMERGISVIIFPEGTRAPSDDALLPFKKGGFMLALETGLPIVPIAVRGGWRLLPRDSWRIHGGTMDVVVGAPIATQGATREALMAQVAAFMREHLALPVAAAVPPLPAAESVA